MNLLAQAATLPKNTPATIKNFEVVFQNIVQVILAFAGLAFFIMFIIGGFKYLSAASGDAKAAEGAKNTLTFAIIGLVLTSLSYLFLVLIANFTGVTEILNFQVGI